MEYIRSGGVVMPDILHIQTIKLEKYLMIIVVFMYIYKKEQNKSSILLYTFLLSSDIINSVD